MTKINGGGNEAPGTTVYLGIGSNLGDRERNMLDGVTWLQKAGALINVKLSSLFESEPVGWAGGPWYLNGAVQAETRLDPFALLRTLQEAEVQAGRSAGERNAPRPLDLDILLFGNIRVNSPTLTIPHSQVLKRAFVLFPLAEIAPDLMVARGITAREAARSLTEHETIRPWSPPARQAMERHQTSGQGLLNTSQAD